MIAALLTPLLVLPQDAAPARDALLRAAPDGTVMALVCEDVPGLVAGLRAGPLGVLWEDEQLAPLRAQLDEAAAELWESEIYPGGPQGSELIGGLEAAALFLGAVEGDEPTAGGVALAVRDDLAHELAAMLAASAATSELVLVDGLEFQVDHGSDGEWMAAGEWLRGMVFAFGREREVALAWARDLVVALEADPGQATPRGLELESRSGAPTALEVHVDVGALAGASSADASRTEREMLERLGLTDLGWASVTFSSAEDGGLEVRASCEVPAPGLFGQWLSLMRPAPLTLGRLAPRDTIDAGFFGLDADGLWSGVQAFVAELDLVDPDAGGPTPSELLAQRLEEVEALIGIDLREALFENLTGEFARFVLPDSSAYAHAPGAPLAAVDTLLAYGSVVLPQVGAVHVVGLRDGSAMEDLIDALIGLAGADGAILEEQVGEHWVQSVDLSELPVQGLSPCWVVLDDALLFSGGLPSLRAVLAQLDDDAPPSWLDDEARSARARALVRSGACALSIADAGAVFDRRVVRPLRELEAALDDQAYGGLLRATLENLVSQPAALQGADPVAQARGYLHQAAEVGGRLVAGPLRGDCLTTLSYADGVVVYRSWTEPAKRD